MSGITFLQYKYFTITTEHIYTTMKDKHYTKCMKIRISHRLTPKDTDNLPFLFHSKSIVREPRDNSWH